MNIARIPTIWLIAFIMPQRVFVRMDCDVWPYTLAAISTAETENSIRNLCRRPLMFFRCWNAISC